MRENLEAEFIGFQKPGGYAEKRIIMVKEKHACSGTRHLLFLLLLLTAIMVPILCSGCSQEVTEPELDNYPYEPDTPAPDPHDGTFVSDKGTMVFNGDGETAVIDFDVDLAKRLGLPAGEQQATYTFLTGNLPPHGYLPTRYDVAMMLRLTVVEGDDPISTMVEIGEYQDGEFFSGTDRTTADRITFFVDDPDGNTEPVEFHKS